MRQRAFQFFTMMGPCLLLVGCTSHRERPEMCSVGKCTIAPKRATSKPYEINGIRYHPQPHYEYDEVGIASYYGGGDIFHGRPTATGKIFDMNGISAAHKTLPLPCVAEVTNLENGRQIQLEINDRGPFVGERIIDVSRRVAQLLGFEGKGTAKVRVRTLVSESLALNGLDSSKVMLVEVAPLTPAVALASSETSSSKGVKELPRLPDSLFEEVEVTAVLAEVSPPPAPSPQKGAVAAASGIFVHVGGYESHAEALALSKKLNGIANSPALAIKNIGLKPYAVQLGPLLSMAHANQVLDQLINAGHLMSRIVIHR